MPEITGSGGLGHAAMHGAGKVNIRYCLKNIYMFIFDTCIAF